MAANDLASGGVNGCWCLVTGGAGLIASRMIPALNASGRDNVVLVDSFARRPEKLATSSQLHVADFVDCMHAEDVARVLIQAGSRTCLRGVYSLVSGVAISHREIADAAVRTAPDPGCRFMPIPFAPSRYRTSYVRSSSSYPSGGCAAVDRGAHHPAAGENRELLD
jgi:nucleoside-diphosphate-sugar epimerase